MSNITRMGVASVPLVPDSVVVVIVVSASTMSGEATAAMANSNTCGRVTMVGSSEFTDSAISWRNQIQVDLHIGSVTPATIIVIVKLQILMGDQFDRCLYAAREQQAGGPPFGNKLHGCMGSYSLVPRPCGNEARGATDLACCNNPLLHPFLILKIRHPRVLEGSGDIQSCQTLGMV